MLLLGGYFAIAFLTMSLPAVFGVMATRAPRPRGPQRRFRMDRAVARRRPVQFNVAANAANNDDSPLGDYIYVKMVRSPPAK